jgi:hypothetical protein
MVGSVAEKAGHLIRQVRSKETSESKPPMNCRKRIVDVKTGAGGRSGMSAGGDPKTGPRRPARRRRDLGSGSRGTGEPVAPMPREKAEREIPARPRVPMRGTGAEQPVLGLKALQRRWTEGAVASCLRLRPPGDGRSRMTQAKPFSTSKREVWEAFKRVKANQGAAGVNGQSIQDFEARLSANLYKLCNRLSSGSYMPPPVCRVDRAADGRRTSRRRCEPAVQRRRDRGQSGGRASVPQRPYRRLGRTASRGYAG